MVYTFTQYNLFYMQEKFFVTISNLYIHTRTFLQKIFVSAFMQALKVVSDL